MNSSDSPLSPEDQATLSQRAEEFNASRSHGAIANWGPFLEGLTGAVRLAVLTELAVLDLAHRWEGGEQPGLEEYVRLYPELGPAGSEPAALVQEYERCLASAGTAAQATQYSKRPAPIVDQFRATLAPGEVRPSPGPVADPGANPAQEVDQFRPTFTPEEAVQTRTVTASGSPKPYTGGFGGGEGLVAVAQNYELIRELGRGAFGEVWLAKKMPSGIEKAVKILHQSADQDSAQRELRSLELIKNLRHPYLLATEDFWVSSNRLYIVTELADTSLRRRLVECKEQGLPAIPIDELFQYIHEAAEGFDYLHTKQITHRDVKPDNILVVNGHAKVADFGLARHHESQVAEMSFAGTPAYMAPEVWGGEGGPPSDLYGFAMSYVELRQGSTPFKLGKVMEMMQVHLGGAFEFSEIISADEADVLRRALARDPLVRHPSCLAFAEDLADALGRPVHRKSGVVATPRNRLLPDANSPSATASQLRATVSDRKELPQAKPLPKKLLAGFAIAILLVIGVVAAMTNRSGNSGGDAHGTGSGTGPGGEVLPNGTVMEPDSKVVDVAGIGRVPEWVVAQRGGQDVRFRLIAPTGADTIPPFFISQSKVWNSLYRTLHADHEGVGGPDAPVMNVSAQEAALFAAQFEGHLPSPEQWDHAAGFYDQRGQSGPFRIGTTIAMRLKEPAPTHGDNPDLPRNQFDLIDMAGNGREWTSAVLPSDGQPAKIVDGKDYLEKDFVVLRGRLYTLKSPLSYEILSREQKDPQAQFGGASSPYTGFRIVLPLPH